VGHVSWRAPHLQHALWRCVARVAENLTPSTRACSSLKHRLTYSVVCHKVCVLQGWRRCIFKKSASRSPSCNVLNMRMQKTRRAGPSPTCVPWSSVPSGAQAFGRYDRSKPSEPGLGHESARKGAFAARPRPRTASAKDSVSPASEGVGSAKPFGKVSRELVTFGFQDWTPTFATFLGLAGFPAYRRCSERTWWMP